MHCQSHKSHSGRALSDRGQSHAKRLMPVLSISILALLLAACSFSPYYGRHTNNLPAGIDGQWVDDNGIISIFSNGLFETRSTDTQEKISEGNYVFRNPQLVEIEVRSIIRGTVSNASCIVAKNNTQLLCSSADGQQFTLNRHI